MTFVECVDGKPSACGLMPGVATVEDLEEKFGAVENVETVEGAQFYTFGDGGIQAAREDNHLCVSTVWINADRPSTKELPATLLQLQEIFRDLKVAERPENGLILAECNGLKVACNQSEESEKVLWLQLTETT